MIAYKVTHWQHPMFYAYFPAGNCYPSIIGEIISAGLGIVGFSWASSPSCTELETIVLDWLGKMLNLPKIFLPFIEESNNNHIKTNGHVSNPSNLIENNDAENEDDDVLIEVPACAGGGVILVNLFY